MAAEGPQSASRSCIGRLALMQQAVNVYPCLESSSPAVQLQSVPAIILPLQPGNGRHDSVQTERLGAQGRFVDVCTASRPRAAEV